MYQLRCMSYVIDEPPTAGTYVSVTYQDCVGESQIITYDGTEPDDQLTYACLSSPPSYVVAGTIDIKLVAGTCEC